MKKLILFLALIIGVTTVSISQTQTYYLKNATSSAITLNPGLGTIAAGDSVLLVDLSVIPNRLPFLKYAVDNNLVSINYLLSNRSLVIKTSGVAMSVTECFTFLATCKNIYNKYIISENSQILVIFNTTTPTLLIYDLPLGTLRKAIFMTVSL